MTIQVSSKQKMTPPAVCGLNPAHHITAKGLIKDPLGRRKAVQNAEGTTSTQEEVMKLCNNCYNKALAEKQQKEGEGCDIDKSHKLGSYALNTDPLGRTKIVTVQNADGSETHQEQVMKVCHNCYRKAFAEKQQKEGEVCGLDPSHHITVKGLTKDPLGRKQIITLQNAEGTASSQEQVMKLCYNCYTKALAEKKQKDGEVCEIDSTHKLGFNGLKTDPLGRKKTVQVQNAEGTTSSQERVMKLCHNCYNKAFAEKQQKDGEVCEIDSTHKLGSNGLKTDPLGRTKIVTVQNAEGTTSVQEQVMKLCYSCYKKAFAEKQQKEGNGCDIDSSHILGSQALNTDPLGRKKTVQVQNAEGTTSSQERVMKLCLNCYKKAFAEKQQKEGEVCDIDISHKLGSRGLSTDPLGRTKIVTVQNAEGTASSQERVMKLCNNCYQKARAEKQQKEGNGCDIDKSHNLGSQPLYSDPLARTKTVLVRNADGSETHQKQMMKVCRNCYNKAKRELKNQANNASPEVSIKTEQEIDSECHVTQVKRTIREVDNLLPILQDPKDPTKSLLPSVEGEIDAIKCANWSFLSSIHAADKKHITDQVHEWLKLNENNRSAYQEKLESIFEVTIPVDEGPLRGVSVFAKQKISKHTVIGPYAGILHLDEDSVEQAIQEKGSYNILSYLFETRSKKRVIDGYATGNVTSVVNTSQLGQGPAWKENNVGALLFGKNLVFYVALRDIDAQEELLIDYGPNYNPFQRIKEESEDLK